MTDQCLIVQQIKLAEAQMNAGKQQIDRKQNLIANPLADENLDIETIVNSTIKLSQSLSNQANQANQLMKSNQTNSNKIAQLNEIYHPVVKGHPHPHSHLLIKPTTAAAMCYSSSNMKSPNSTNVQKEINYLNLTKEDNNQLHKLSICENKQLMPNLNSFYKTQLDYDTFFCCEACSC